MIIPASKGYLAICGKSSSHKNWAFDEDFLDRIHEIERNERMWVCEEGLSCPPSIVRGGGSCYFSSHNRRDHWAEVISVLCLFRVFFFFFKSLACLFYESVSYWFLYGTVHEKPALLFLTFKCMERISVGKIRTFPLFKSCSISMTEAGGHVKYVPALSFLSWFSLL